MCIILFNNDSLIKQDINDEIAYLSQKKNFKARFFLSQMETVQIMGLRLARKPSHKISQKDSGVKITDN